MQQKLNGWKMNGHHLFFSLSFNNSNVFHFSFFLSAEWIRPLRWWLTTVSWHAANVTQKLLIWLVRWTVIVSPSRLPRFAPCCRWISLIRAINPSRPLRNVPSSRAGLPYHSSRTHPGPITLSTGSNILCPLSLKTLSHSIQGRKRRKRKKNHSWAINGLVVMWFFFFFQIQDDVAADAFPPLLKLFFQRWLHRRALRAADVCLVTVKVPTLQFNRRFLLPHWHTSSFAPHLVRGVFPSPATRPRLC